MIVRIVSGVLREVPAADRAKAWQTMSDALKTKPGFQGIYCVDRPANQEGVLTISFWDSEEDAVKAIASNEASRGMAGFSLMLGAPPKVEYVPVALAVKP